MAVRLHDLFRKSFTPSRFLVHTRVMSQWGEGAGKGGGSGGSIRDAGGSFGKMEAAREEEYFKRKQREQLKNLKFKIKDELDHHDDQIRMHKEAIERHQRKIREIEKEEQKLHHD